MQLLAQEVSKWPVAGSLEHVPGKGLLSSWPIPYAHFSYASTAGHYQGLDVGISGPLIWPHKSVFKLWCLQIVVLGIGTARNSYPAPFCEEISNIYLSLFRSLAVVRDWLSLWWESWYLSLRGVNWDYVLTVKSCNVTNAKYLVRFVSF